MKNILIILGTRPEAIKLAPLILLLKRQPNLDITVCNTEQQKELSNQTLGYFHIQADVNLDAMRPNQSLASIQARLVTLLDDLLKQRRYDAVIVQGDTMSVFCGALAAFFNGVRVYHIEAGLRSYDLHEPFPEEALRQMVSRITDLHFAPTSGARDHLIREGVNPQNIHVTGNTVIDALHSLPSDVQSLADTSLEEKGISLQAPIVLVTCHRRENLIELANQGAAHTASRLVSITNAIKELAAQFSDHQFALPVHPNPLVRNYVREQLEQSANVILTAPLMYPELVAVMKRAKLILTDSGGIQEEAPTFGVPLLVMRYETERMEGVLAGCSELVGADHDTIVAEASKVLTQSYENTRLHGIVNPYGDGKACERILRAILQ